MKFAVTHHCPRGPVNIGGNAAYIQTTVVEAEGYLEALKKVQPGFIDVDKVEITIVDVVQ